MPRTSRKVSATKMYHIMIRGNNKETVFKTHTDKRKFMKNIGESVMWSEEKVEIYAFCIMVNHAHFLIRGELEDISKFMKEIETSYAIYYNLNRDRVGHVFQGRYKSECVEEEAYFWTCFCYIHENPVKAGIVHSKEQYSYSSYMEYRKQRCEFVHWKALLMYNKKYDLMCKDEKVLELQKYTVIMDSEEEMMLQKQTIIKNYMQIFLFMNQIESEHILINTPKIRIEFSEFVKEKTGIPQTEIVRILKEL